MHETPFMAGMHHFHKAMAEVHWPATKNEILKTVGHLTVKTDWNKEQTMAELIEPIQLDSFDNAAQFYCAYFASM